MITRLSYVRLNKWAYVDVSDTNINASCCGACLVVVVVGLGCTASIRTATVVLTVVLTGDSARADPRHLRPGSEAHERTTRHLRSPGGTRL